MPKKDIADLASEVASQRWEATKTEAELIREALDAFYSWRYNERKTEVILQYKTMAGEEIFTCLDTLMMPCDRCGNPHCINRVYTTATAVLQRCGNGFIVLKGSLVSGGAQ